MKIFFALFLTLTCFTVLAQPGRVDTTFNAPFYNLFETGNGFGGHTVNQVCEQPDGKLLVAGGFITNYNSSAQGCMVRLNPNGSLDPTFNTGTIFQGSNSEFTSMVLQNDGKIIVIRENGGSTIMRRLNTDGSLDPTPIIPGTLQGSAVKALIQPDGKLLLCGNFVSQNGGQTIWYHLVRINTDGSLDQTFLGGTGSGFTFSSSTAISELKLDSQGKILIIGGFDTYNGINSKGIIRLNSDGTVDPTFDSGTGFNNLVRSIAIQPDQKIILAGDFTQYKTTYVPAKIIRLNANGTPDLTFQFTQSTTSANMLNVMPDSSIIFTSSYSVSIPPMNNRLVRVMSNGVLDTITEGHETHGPGGGNAFSQIKLLSSGKLLLIGQFETAFNRYR